MQKLLVKIEGYEIFRSDREGRKKNRGRNSGGVALYLRNDIAASASIIMRSSDGLNEALGVHIKKLNLIIFIIYRSPCPEQDHVNRPQNKFQKVLSSIKTVLDSMLISINPMPDIMVAGDFNLPKSHWPDCTPKSGATLLEKDILSHLAELSSQFFLQQIVEKPTHRCGNILDLLLTNNPSLFLNHMTVPTSPISSHHIVEFTTTIDCEWQIEDDAHVDHCPFDRHNILSPDTNWAEIKAELQCINWQALFENLDTQSMLSLLIEVCEEAVSKFSPKRKPKKSNKSHIPRHRRVLMKKTIPPSIFLNVRITPLT